MVIPMRKARRSRRISCKDDGAADGQMMARWSVVSQMISGIRSFVSACSIFSDLWQAYAVFSIEASTIKASTIKVLREGVVDLGD